MTSGTMTLNEIRRRGIEALVRDLGPVGAARFLQQFETGSGDWTKERHEILDKVTLGELREKLGNGER